MAVRFLVFVFAAMILSSTPGHDALAQETFVVVPDAPGGAIFTGCYRGDPRLWGRYRLNFCLTRQGTYSVTGGGISCNGRVTWRTRRGEIIVTVERSRCGNGVAWERAEMTCRGGSILGNIIGQILAPNVMPSLQTLRCTYRPSVPGYSNQQITGRRTS